MIERIAIGFHALLKDFSLAEVETNSDPVFGLRADMRLAYFNFAWFKFAQENGGEPAISNEWGLGRSIFDAIPAEIHDFYRKLFQTGMQSWRAKERIPVSHEFECSSADVYRRYAEFLYPLAAGQGLLVVTSLVCEQPHDPIERPACQPELQSYADENGMIHQCAHCRRVENLSIPGRWDWVPYWVNHTPWFTSHTICSFCFNRFYIPSAPYPR
jgi:hypothetical protein